MTRLLQRLRKDRSEHAQTPVTSSELTEAELREYEAASLARYRAMTGMDIPREERAAHARKAAARVNPVTVKTW